MEKEKREDNSHPWMFILVVLGAACAIGAAFKGCEGKQDHGAIELIGGIFILCVVGYFLNKMSK